MEMMRVTYARAYCQPCSDSTGTPRRLWSTSRYSHRCMWSDERLKHCRGCVIRVADIPARVSSAASVHIDRRTNAVEFCTQV